MVPLAHQPVVGQRAGGQLGGAQLYLIIAGVMLGPTALGGLKAAQGLVAGPTTLVINAGGSFGLPEATKQLADRGWPGMVKVSRFVSGAGVAVFARLRHCHPDRGADAPPSAVRPRVRPVRDGRQAVRHFGHHLSLRRGADHHLDGHPAGASALRHPVGKAGPRRDVGGRAGPRLRGQRRRDGRRADGRVSTIATVLVQSWTRRSYEGTERRPVTAALRRRLVKNAEFLLTLSPEPPALVPPSDSPSSNRSTLLF